ncbi:meiotic recombination protein SPO11 [Xenopus tropicalis]|uniref:DNA topoisomerase (ATP-hydrolyzing) n=1 Tax=Xenopus tropicalis TaxID=8364 RepID=F7API5_XENTR|eukprot:NP_001008200.1 meiotic recombination protein SPO11 [Xenopus tropicalis]
MDLLLSPDFFQYVERHRASLLKKLQENVEQSSSWQGETQENITSSQVLAAIERIIQGITESLSKNEAPVLTLDNRTNWANIEFNHLVGLQIAKHCTTRKVRSNCAKSAQKFALMLKVLSVIYKLVQTDTYTTKRDIYYNDVQLYGSQTVVDNIVSDLSCMLKIPRINLHILSTSKGCVAGDLWFTAEDGSKVYCGGSSSGVLVPINVEGIRHLSTQAKFILIIEKDATFQRLLDDNFCARSGPCILITGKGVPDLNTRLLTRKLWDSFHIPIFTLVDADPYGTKLGDNVQKQSSILPITLFPYIFSFTFSCLCFRDRNHVHLQVWIYIHVIRSSSLDCPCNCMAWPPTIRFREVIHSQRCSDTTKSTGPEEAA